MVPAILGGLLGMIVAGGAVAQGVPVPKQSPPVDGPAAAEALTRLFMRTCLQHAGDIAGLRAALAGSGYQRAPDEAGARLLMRPGQAYRVPDAPGHLMVLSFDDGWCGDGGTGIEPHALTMQLAASVQARGADMRLMGAGPDGREQRYLLTMPPPAMPIVLLVLLQPSGRLMQANLFAAPMPPEPGIPGALPQVPGVPK